MSYASSAFLNSHSSALKCFHLSTHIRQGVYQFLLFPFTTRGDDSKIIPRESRVVGLEAFKFWQTGLGDQPDHISQDCKQNSEFEPDNEKRKPSDYRFSTHDQVPLHSRIGGEGETDEESYDPPDEGEISYPALLLFQGIGDSVTGKGAVNTV